MAHHDSRAADAGHLRTGRGPLGKEPHMKFPADPHDRALAVICVMAAIIVSGVIGLSYAKTLGMIDISRLGKGHLVPGAR